MGLAPLERHIVFRVVDGYLTTGIPARSCPVPMEMAARRGYTGSGPARELMTCNGLAAAGVERAARRAISRKS